MKIIDTFARNLTSLTMAEVTRVIPHGDGYYGFAQTADKKTIYFNTKALCVPGEVNGISFTGAAEIDLSQPPKVGDTITGIALNGGETGLHFLRWHPADKEFRHVLAAFESPTALKRREREKKIARSSHHEYFRALLLVAYSDAEVLAEMCAKNPEVENWVAKVTRGHHLGNLWQAFVRECHARSISLNTVKRQDLVVGKNFGAMACAFVVAAHSKAA